MKTTTLKNELLRVIGSCEDSATIYMAAAEHTENEDLQNTLLLFALQRKNFVELLYSETRKAGYRLKKQDSFFKQFRQYLNALMISFSSGNDEKIAQACSDCDSALIRLYDEVLSNPEISGTLSEILKEHRRLIRVTGKRHLLLPAH